MNVQGDQSSANSNDDVKEAVNSMVEELLQVKMDEVVNRLENKIQNASEEVS